MLNNNKSWAFALFLMAFVSSPITPVSALKNAALDRARSLQGTNAPSLSPWDCQLGEFYSQSDDTCKQCDGSCPLCFGTTPEDCLVCPNGQVFDLEELKCIDFEACRTKTSAMESFNKKYTVVNFSIFEYAEELLQFEFVENSASKACRPNVVYINPSSEKYLELGTYEYPFKRLTDAQYEVFNNFYLLEVDDVLQVQAVLLALEKSQDVIFKDFFIVDTVSVTISTYTQSETFDPSTGNCDIVTTNTPEDELLEQKGKIVVTTEKTQSIGKESRFKAYKGSQYDFSERLEINEEHSLQRQSLSANMNKVSSFKYPFFNVFNASLDIQNMEIESQELEPISTDYFMYYIDGGERSALTMVNNNLDVRMRFLITLAMSEVYFKSCYMDISKFNYHFINYVPDPSGCASTINPGFLTIDTCNFTGVSPSTESFFIKHQAMNQFTLKGSTFTNFGSRNSMDSGLIAVLVDGTCQEITNGAMLPFLIKDNTFSNDPVMPVKINILVYISTTDIDMDFQITGNHIKSMNNPKTFLKFITNRSATSSKANIDLTIGFTVENVKLTGDQTRVFDVVHMLSGTIDVLSLDVSDSNLDQIISIDAYDSQVKLSDLRLTDIRDLNAYLYKQALVRVVNAQSLEMIDVELIKVNTRFAQVFQIGHVENLSIEGFVIKESVINKQDVIGIQNAEKVSITGVQMEKNRVTSQNKVHLVMIASLQCLSHSDVLTIEGMQEMTTIGVNQLPFVYIANINSPSQQEDAKHDIYKVVLRNLEFKNCEVKSDHLINIGQSSINNVSILLENIVFKDNIIQYYSLVYMQSYSQDVKFTSVAFSNNKGSLLVTNPIAIEEPGDQNLVITAINLQIIDNKNRGNPLIQLQQKTKLEVRGEAPHDLASNTRITGNRALTNFGVISLYQSDCLLTIEYGTISDNAALNGGVFSIKFNGAVECTQCIIENNAAVIGGFAHLTNDARIVVQSSEIMKNYALNSQMIFMSSNVYLPSEIRDTIIRDNRQFESDQARKEDFKKLMEEAFDGIEDFSFLEQVKNSNTEDSSIQMIRSKLQILDNSKVFDQAKFIQAALQSQITIAETHFQPTSNQEDYIVKLLNSIADIQGCTFTEIKSSTSTNSIYLFYVSINSALVMRNSGFTDINVQLFTLHSSSLRITSVTVNKIAYNEPVIESTISTIAIEESRFEELTTSLQKPIFNILEDNQVTFFDTVITNMNSQVITIRGSTLLLDETTIEKLRDSSLMFETSPCISSTSSGITIKNSRISDMQSQTFGGALYVHQNFVNRKFNDQKVKITGTTFKNCQSEYGGAIYAEDVDISISENTVFDSNQATYGGAIYFKCCETCSADVDEYICSQEFANSECKSNVATAQGGCFHTNLYPVDGYTTSTYSDNSAVYGPDYSAYAFGARLVSLEGETYTNATAVINSVSGQTIPEPFFIALFDFFGQIKNDEDSAIGKIKAKVGDESQVELQVQEQDQAISNQGLFNFSSTRFTRRPGDMGEIQFESQTIESDKFQRVLNKPYTQFFFTVDLRFCTAGEAISGNVCSPCGAGTYSLVENSDDCKNCPDHATCEGVEIKPDYGYWRSTNTSTDITRCLFPDACPGGEIAACRSDLGYKGVLCHECIYKEDDPDQQFTRQDQHQCARCPGREENIRTYSLIFFFNMVYIFFLTQSYYKNLVLEQESAVVLRVFTTYTQVIVLISQFDLQWPQSISGLFTGMGAPAEATSALYSIECLLKDYQFADQDIIIYITLTITALQPVIQFVLALLVYFICWLCKMKKIKLKLLLTGTVIFYLAYPQIVQNTFALLRCTSQIDGVSYLVLNTSITCFGASHIKLVLFLGLPILVLWIFGIPAVILYTLYKKRKDLDNIDNIRTFGFWYLGIRRECYFWESLQEYKKLLIIIITVDIVGMGQSYQAFLVLLILYLYFVLSSNLKPYKVSYINRVSFYSEFAQLSTFAFVMVYIKESDNQVINNLVLILIIMINALFWIQFGFYYGRYQYRVIKEALAKVKKMLKKKAKIEDDDQDNMSKGSDEQEPQARKVKKRRKAPSGAKLYKSSLSLGRMERQRGSMLSMESPSLKSDNDMSSKVPAKADEIIYSPQDKRRDHLSPESSEFRRLQKIEHIKALKQQKQQKKKKMMAQDGPIGIKIEDYINEEKRRLKREQKKEEAKLKEQEDREEEKEEEQAEQYEERIPIKDFNLAKDKNGHLLNADVLETLKKLQ